MAGNVSEWTSTSLMLMNMFPQWIQMY
jgi:hypothetical protein